MIFKSSLLALFTVILFGCHESGPYVVEIIDSEKSNGETLAYKEVTMSSDVDLLHFKSEHLVFKKDLLVPAQEFSKVAIKSNSFADWQEKILSNLSFAEYELPNLLQNGVYRGRNNDEKILLSSFYHLHNILDFYKNLKLDTNTRPLLVGFLASMVIGDKAAPLFDNASFVGGIDGILLFPHKNSQVPINANEGVLAHEAFHRFFFNNLWMANDDPSLWQKYQGRYYEQDLEPWRKLLFALDEGLADFFAFVYTGNPNYLALSSEKHRPSVVEQRKLNGDFAEIATYEKLSFGPLDEKYLKVCRGYGRNWDNPQFNLYCLGTVIAKSFYEASNRSSLEGREFLPIIFESLQKLAKPLVEEKLPLSPFLENVALSMKLKNKTLAQNFCQQMQKRFAFLIKEGHIQACQQI